MHGIQSQARMHETLKKGKAGKEGQGREGRKEGNSEGGEEIRKKWVGGMETEKKKKKGKGCSLEDTICFVPSYSAWQSSGVCLWCGYMTSP